MARPVDLPVDAHLPAIHDALARHRAVVVTAPPGAGKTTRVPPSLLGHGTVVLLQPRRVAARAIARRIADEQGWTVGRQVGWHVRFDRRTSEETVLTVATEGILTARLQQDPLLTGVATIVLDEFHERSIHADVGLALARQAWLARDDLRLVVMSATIDASAVSAYLGDCPVVSVPGRQFPLTIDYYPGEEMGAVVRRMLPDAHGAILCFLPGAREIARVAQALTGVGVPVLPLHGGLTAEAQDGALHSREGVRVILATNLAETTVTVPDVTVVIDSGLQKVARYDAERAIDMLRVERVPQDSADQRAGRAGRVQAGQAVRLWDSRDRLRVHREAEILRVDLAAPLLDVIAWGGDPRTFEWFEAPATYAVDAALELLRRLEAIDAKGRLTREGARVQRLALHPRLGRLLLTAGGTPRAARVCAALADGADPEVFELAWDGRALPAHLERVAEHLVRQVQRTEPVVSVAGSEDDRLRKAVLAAFPDRVARRRTAGSERCLLASGAGATLSRGAARVMSGDHCVALDVTAAPVAGSGEALIRLAIAIEPEWLVTNRTEVRHRFDADSGRVRATRVDGYDALVLVERQAAGDPVEVERILLAAWLERWQSRQLIDDADPDVQLLRRLAFVGGTPDVAALAGEAVLGATRLDDIRLASVVSGHALRDAPESLTVPSGRAIPLRYDAEGGVTAAVKLQELFGLAETPKLGPRRTPVTFELLAPNRRPVQITRDLKSFWARGYPEVRRELRARYPRHPWPDDPWTATPTHRTVRRRE